MHDNGSISGMDDKGVVGANWTEEVFYEDTKLGRRKEVSMG